MLFKILAKNSWGIIFAAVALRPQKGFTVVEMLVALSILSVWLWAVGQFLSRSTDTFTRKVQDAEQLLQRNRARRQLEEDLQGVAFDEICNPQKGQFFWPLKAQPGLLCRYTWDFAQGKLYRILGNDFTPIMEVPITTDQPLLNGVEEFALSPKSSVKIGEIGISIHLH